MAAIGEIPQQWWASCNGERGIDAHWPGAPRMAQRGRDRISGTRTKISMEKLRRAHRLVWLVLAWFALSIGAAVASPAINLQSQELVCSGAHGTKLVVTGDSGAPHAGHHLGDCPLCVTAGAPPPVAAISAAYQPPAHAPVALVAVYIVAFAAAPPAARGPPSI